jgi:hypothetical protein
MRGKPTYDLQYLQQLVGQGELTSSITTAAADGASFKMLTTDHITEAVLLLMPEHFYKTMESDQMPGLWQDVYTSSTGASSFTSSFRSGVTDART